MKPEPTVMRVCLSPNERGSARHTALASVLQRHPERYVVSWEDPGIDATIGPLGVEFKETADYVGSLFNGHLGNQRRQAKALEIPCCVAVLGSPLDVIEAIPTQGPNGYKDHKEMYRDVHRVIKGDAALFASGFTPMYMGSDYDIAMELLVARANAMSTGNIALPGVKAETTQEAMMRCLPRVGPTLSTEMRNAGIKVALVAEVIRTGQDGTRSTEFTVIKDPGLLRMVRGMGPKTASGIIEALK